MDLDDVVLHYARQQPDRRSRSRQRRQTNDRSRWHSPRRYDADAVIGGAGRDLYFSLPPDLSDKTPPTEVFAVPIAGLDEMAMEVAKHRRMALSAISVMSKE
jgi:hypothetical protein